MLKLCLFGSPQIQESDRLLHTDVTGRVLALFAYLVLKDGPHERSLLADLLWSEMSEKQAKTNLRYVLYDLRKILGDYLTVTRQTVAFDPEPLSWVDAHVFAQFMASDLTAAEPQLIMEVLKLYRGDLLEGFYIQGAPNFENWLEQQRRHFHHQATHSWHRLSQTALNNGSYELCISAGRQLLALDPGYEEAHRLLMQGLAYAGQRTAALAQYAQCQEILQLEYAVAPDDLTTELFYQIQRGDLSAAVGEQSASIEAARQSQPGPHCQPPMQRDMQVNWEAIPQPHTFVGREDELDQLTSWAGQDRYQLIGLFGLPGQGKSTLAAELVGSLAEAPMDDTLPPFERVLWYSATAFVSLGELLQFWCHQLDLARGTLPEQVMPWTVTVGAQGNGSASLEPTLQKLLSHLRNQRVLLVLDDLDHLITAHGSSGRRDSALANVAYPTGEHEFNDSERRAPDGLNELLRRIAETEHGSCLLVVSGIVPTAWRALSQQCSSVRHLTLTGFQCGEIQTLLRISGLQAAADQIDDSVAISASNPKLLAQRIHLAREFGSDLMFISITADSLDEEVHKLLYPFFRQLPGAAQDVLLNMVNISTNGDAPGPTVQSLWQRAQGQMMIATYLQSLDLLQRYHLLEIDGPDKKLTLPELARQFIEIFLYRSIAGEILLLLHNHRQRYTQRPVYRVESTVDIKHARSDN